MNDTDFLNNGVTAHRGNPEKYAQNTISAFADGIRIGADWLELDVQFSKDGKLVVIHDFDTDYVAGEKHLVAETDSKVLRQLDFAHYMRDQNPDEVHKSEQIPFLEEVLELVKQQRRTRVSIQPKVDCVEAVAKLVKSLDMEEWVGFNDGHLEYMIAGKQLLPKATIFWDRYIGIDFEQDLKISVDHGFEAMVIHRDGVTAERVQELKEAGIEPGVWTVNEPEAMREFLEMGVFRIYTDRPQVLLNLKKEMKLI